MLPPARCSPMPGQNHGRETKPELLLQWFCPSSGGIDICGWLLLDWDERCKTAFRAALFEERRPPDSRDPRGTHTRSPPFLVGLECYSFEPHGGASFWIWLVYGGGLGHQSGRTRGAMLRVSIDRFSSLSLDLLCVARLADRPLSLGENEQRSSEPGGKSGNATLRASLPFLRPSLSPLKSRAGLAETQPYRHFVA